MIVEEQINTSLKNDQQLAEILVEPLDQDLSEKIQSIKYIDKIYFTRIDADLSRFKIIKQSTPLFRYILNEVEETNSENKSVCKLKSDFHDDENSNIIQDGRNYVASVDGLFIIEHEHPKIIPVNLDGSAEVRVSGDSMFVHLDIYPSVAENPIPTLEDIVDKVQKLGVLTNIDRTLIDQKLNEVKTNKRKFLDLCISTGKMPINGVDGRLENCTNKKDKFENLDFSEFHKINPVISVKDGETIAIIHPPTEGESGSNVFGNPVEPIPGKEYPFKLGTNTKYSEEDETKIIAKIDGFLNLSDSSISISETFTVHGDIDFKSGNIVSKGSLKVLGNVNNEFTLKLTKDIEIGGYVGDATVEAGQNLLIRGGFLGKGKGIIKAEGDISVKFVENQKVYTRGNLVLGKEALNAQLYVKNKIHTKGTKAVIVGGHAIAGDSIEVYSLGSNTESETIVEVGFDYRKRNSILDNKETQIRLRQTLEEVDKKILEFAQMKRLNDQFREKVQILADEHKRLVTEIENLKEENLKITNEIYVPTTSKISIGGPIYPGVKVGINGRFFIVKEPMRAKSFFLSNDNEVIAV